MTPREQEVMDLLDSGVCARRVAQDTGLSLDYVRRCRTRYNYDTISQEESRQRAAIRASTMALEAAILATGKRHS